MRSLQNFESALDELGLEPGTDVYKAGLVMFVAADIGTIIADEIAKHLKGTITRKEVRVICRRLRESRIFAYGEDRKPHIYCEWNDEPDGVIAFILDAMVGAGDLKRTHDG